jgi:hypothetical protein
MYTSGGWMTSCRRVVRVRAKYTPMLPPAFATLQRVRMRTPPTADLHYTATQSSLKDQLGSVRDEADVLIVGRRPHQFRATR